MAETYKITPGSLDLEIHRGDEFGMTITVNRDLTGYTVGASIGGVSATATTSNITADTSDINISLQESVVVDLPPAARWKLWWVAPGGDTAKRTILAGEVRVYE